jgi:hypothetical protein
LAPPLRIDDGEVKFLKLRTGEDEGKEVVHIPASVVRKEIILISWKQ